MELSLSQRLLVVAATNLGLFLGLVGFVYAREVGRATLHWAARAYLNRLYEADLGCPEALRHQGLGCGYCGAGYAARFADSCRGRFLKWLAGGALPEKYR